MCISALYRVGVFMCVKDGLVAPRGYPTRETGSVVSASAFCVGTSHGLLLSSVVSFGSSECVFYICSAKY